MIAVQAHQLGIVDKEVSLEDLDRMARESARDYARIPTGYSSGIKKLLNFGVKELSNYLEFESEQLRKLIESGA